MRYQPQAGPARVVLDDAHSRVEQRRVAAELVDQKARHHGGILGRDDGFGPDDLGDDAAPVDIADQHDRHIGAAREAHVGDVVGPEVDLGRAAGAFDQHEIGLLAKASETVEHGLHQARLPVLVFPGLGIAEHAALHHHLAAHLALRLQQHGVHVHARRHPRGPRLQGLGAADLAAIRRHGGIVGHVLRLEGSDAKAASKKGPAQARDDQRLADIRPRALQHQDFGGHRVTLPRSAHPRARGDPGKSVGMMRTTSGRHVALGPRFREDERAAGFPAHG